MESQPVNFLLLPSVKPAESLRGYMFRTARTNAFPRLYTQCANIFDNATSFIGLIARRDPELRRKLEVGSWKLEGRLAPSTGAEDASPSLLLGDEWIPSKYVFIQTRKVCPVCLELNGWARCEWELKSLVACAHHKVELVSQCSSCLRSLTWSSTELLHCCCGQALASIKAKPAMNNEVVWARKIQRAASYSIHGDLPNHKYSIPERMRLSQLLLMAEVVRALVLKKHSKSHASWQTQKQWITQVLSEDDFRQHMWETMFLHAASDPFTFVQKLRLGQNIEELIRNYSEPISELGIPRVFVRQHGTKPISPTERSQRWQRHLRSLKRFYQERLKAGCDPFDPAFARCAGEPL